MDIFTTWLKKAGLDEKMYQREGVEWMMKRETEPSPFMGVRGGVLADEMGLGKTIQIMGLMLVNYKEPTLIVLPPALVHQWKKEIQKLLGHTPIVYHGYYSKKTSIETLQSAPLVITTYGMISARRSTKESTPKPSMLSKVKWGRVVYDEAHYLRNKTTMTHIGAKMLKTNSTWLVTGTPIHNKVDDYYSLCDILKLPSVWSRDMSNMQDFNDHLILRRTKEGVGIKIPALKIHSEVVSWESVEEKELAMDIHSALELTKVTKKNVNKLISLMTHHRLAALLRMKQVCVMPELLKKKINELADSGVIDDQHKTIDEDRMAKTMHTKSKLNAVLKKVEERKHCGKKIIFSNYRSEIDYLTLKITEMGLNVDFIDGRKGKRERKFILDDEFLDVLILQINTTCEGLNLQQFNEIYFTNPHWNPAVEDQAIARAHRIGQTKPVHVFKFEMEKFDGKNGKEINLDNYCNMIQDEKRGLADMLL